jgi:hypothetical protein
MTKQLTRARAEAALAAVRKHYQLYYIGAEGPKLFPPDEDRECWLISWEEGPYEWAYRASDGGIDPEVLAQMSEFNLTPERAREAATFPAINFPRGVYVEPYYSYALGLTADEA